MKRVARSIAPGTKLRITTCVVAALLGGIWPAPGLSFGQPGDEDKKLAPQVEAAKDTLILTNGTSIVGVIIDETDASVRMLVMVANLRTESVYAKADIQSILRGHVEREAPAQSAAYSKPVDVEFVTPVLVRGSPASISHKKDGSTAEVTLWFYIACSADTTAVFVPGEELSSGNIGRFRSAQVIESTTRFKSKNKDLVAQALAREALIRPLNLDTLVPTLYALRNDRVFAGTLRKATIVEPPPAPGKCPPEEYEVTMLIEWRASDLSIDSNAILLTVFGQRYRELAVRAQEVARKCETELADAQDLLRNGLAIGCDHCGGDGKLTGKDQSRFTLEELEEYQRVISAAAAGAGNGMTRVTITVRCSVCTGSGRLGSSQPSAPLAARLREYIEIQRRGAEKMRESHKHCRAMLTKWESNPTGLWDAAESEERIKRGCEETIQLIEDVQRSRAIFAEIRRLLYEETLRQR